MSFGSLGPSEFSKSSHSSWICHQNALTEKAWEDTVQDKARALCNQAFFLSSLTFSGTETPSSVHSFFFVVRPTDPPSQETGRWKTKHFLGWPYKRSSRAGGKFLCRAPHRKSEGDSEVIFRSSNSISTKCIVVYDVDEEGRFSQKCFWREIVIAVVILLRVLARIW